MKNIILRFLLVVSVLGIVLFFLTAEQFIQNWSQISGMIFGGIFIVLVVGTLLYHIMKFIIKGL